MPDFEDGLRTGTTVEVITDSHSVRTNPEVSVRPMARCGRFTAVRRGHKTQSLQLLDQFLSKSMDQSPAPAQCSRGVSKSKFENPIFGQISIVLYIK